MRTALGAACNMQLGVLRAKPAPTRASSAEERVTPLELFFDLIFVFAGHNDLLYQLGVFAASAQASKGSAPCHETAAAVASEKQPTRTISAGRLAGNL